MKLFCFCCLLGFLMLACTYSPIDGYYKTVNKPDLTDPKYSISLNSYKEGDTIALYSSPDFTYNISVAQGKVEKVEVLLANRVVYSDSIGTLTKGTFNLKNYLTTGIYDLKVQYVASSGTGSFADVVGAEKIQMWKSWILKVDVNAPPAPNIKSSIVNGFLTFTWDKYTKPNFQSYNLFFERYKYENSAYTFNVTIKDPNTTFWVDSSYVGGAPISCRIFTVGYSYGQQSTISFTKRLELKITYNQLDSVVTLGWTKSPYYNAFQKYQMSSDYKPIKSFLSVTDTSYSFKLTPTYGADASIQLQYFQKYPNSNYGTYYERLDQAIPTPIASKKIPRPFSNLYYNKGTNSILAVNKIQSATIIYQFSTSFALVDSMVLYHGESSRLFPYSGTKYYYNGDPGYAYATNILSKQETSQMVNTSTSAPYSLGPTLLSASGNGILCYNYWGLASTGNIEVHNAVVNLNNNTSYYNDSKVVATSTLKPDVLAISDDGTAIRYNNNFFKVTGGTLTPIGTIPSGSFIGFRPDNASEMMVSGSQGVNIYNSADISFKRLIPWPNSDAGYVFSQYDPFTKEVLFINKNSTSAYLVNVDTQSQREIKVTYDNVYLAKYLCGYFITPNGTYFKI